MTFPVLADANGSARGRRPILISRSARADRVSTLQSGRHIMRIAYGRVTFITENLGNRQ
jgi:hypothetical protein